MWVVATNTNICKIYNYNKEKKELTLYKEINHPEFKQKTSETITTERVGSHMSQNSTHGAYEPKHDAKEVEFIKFAKEISTELEHGRNNNLYNQLIIISLPHMNGLLHQKISKHIKDLVFNNIQKDIMHLNDNEIIDFLKSHALYSC